MVAADNAIEKGNFRVWTFPADPEAMEDYQIIIEVKLPDNTTTYSRNDLSGYVRGTDGIRSPIGIGFLIPTGSVFSPLNIGGMFDQRVKCRFYQELNTHAFIKLINPKHITIGPQGGDEFHY